MKVTLIRYERLISTAPYENIKIGVEVLVEEGDTAQAAYEAAKAFVARQVRQSEATQDPPPDAPLTDV